ELRQWRMSEWSDPYRLQKIFDAAGGLSTTTGSGHIDKGKQCRVPDGWEWDNNQDNVELRLNFPRMREHHIEKVGDAPLFQTLPSLTTPSDDVGWWVGQQYHVGIDCTKSTPAGRGLNYRDSTRCAVDEPTYATATTVEMRIGLNPVLTPSEAAAKKAYEDQMDVWNRLAAEQSANANGQLPSTYNPLSELMCKLSKTFGSENTDDYWEIEYWHRLFDWDNAAYNLYP